MHKIQMTLPRPNLLIRLICIGFLLAAAAFYIDKPKTELQSAGINEKLNFQARLLDDSGAVVPDGTYNIRFKIYQDGDGCVGGGSSPCSGTLEWTETREGADKVTIKNGYFSVYLGSVTPFGTDIDWNQDSLWLSIDIGGTGSPSYDGEMLPFTRFSSTPYALNAGKLGGLSKTEFMQLGQGVQVDASTNSSIYVNKTGASGNIVQLQRGGADVLLINNTGELLFKPQTDDTDAFRVQNAAGTATVLTADTTNKRVGINNTSASASLHVQGSSASEVVSKVQGNSSTQTGDLMQYLNSSGEMLGRIDAGGNIVAALDPPSTALTATVDSGSYSLTGDYSYVVTFLTAYGETFAGPASTTVTASTDRIDLSNIPIGPTGTKARKIYRSTAHTDGVTTNWRFLTQINDNTTTTHDDDNTADTSLTYSPPNPIAPPQQAPVPSDVTAAGGLTGAYSYKATFITPWGETAPSPVSATVNPASEYIALSSMPVAPRKQASAVRIYRTQAGGSTYYYNPTLRITGTSTNVSGTITDSSVASRDDNNADGSLNTSLIPPTGENTTSKPTAPTATLTGTPGNLFSPNVYVYGYTYVNASGAESPLSYTSSVWPFGADNQANITNISAGPPGTVARKLYRTFGLNGFTNQLGPFALIATLGDNSTTTYLDNTDNRTLRWDRTQHVGNVGAGIVTNNLKVTAPQGTPPLVVSSTTQVDNLNAELLGGNDQIGIKDFTWNMDESLKHYRAAVANASSEAVVVNYIGDSITWGLGLSDRREKATPNLLNTHLQERYGDGGSGFQKAYDNENWVQSDPGTHTLERTDVTADGAIEFCNDGSGSATMTIQFRGSSVDLHYKYDTNLDTMHYVIDGGTKTGDINQSGTAQAGRTTAITGLDPSKTHTLVLSVNGGSGNCAVIAGIDAKFDTGIRVNNIATSGSFVSTAYDKNDAAFGAFNPTPDLVILAYGTNEHGNEHTPQSYKAAYSKVIGQAKRSSKPADCILVAPGPQPDDERYHQEAYREMIYQVAEEWECGVLDLYRKWNEDFDWAVEAGLFTDGSGGAGVLDDLHVSDKGAADVASTLLNFLDNGLKSNKEVTASNEIRLNGGQLAFSALTAPQQFELSFTPRVAPGTLTNGAVYRYVVTALNEYGETSPSTEDSATVPSSTNVLQSAGVLQLNWLEVPGATKYRVYRCATANCASGSGYPQYFETYKAGAYDDGNLTWKTGSPPSSTANSTFSGALLQGTSETALSIAQNTGDQVMRVDTSINQLNLVANSGFEQDTATNYVNDASFEQNPGTNWAAKGSATVSSNGTYYYDKAKALHITTTAAANDGAKYNITLAAATYELNFWARTGSGSGSVLQAGYADDGSTETNCTLNSSSISTSWANYTCTFTVSSTSGTPYFYIKQSDATARTIALDKVSLKTVTAPSGWAVKDSATAVFRTEAQQYAGYGSMQFNTAASAGSGVKYPIVLDASSTYTASFQIRASAIAFLSIAAGYSDDGSAETNCTSAQSALTTGWALVTCTIATGGSIDTDAYFYIEQTDSTARSFYIDAVSIEAGSTPRASNPGGISLNGTITSPILFRNTADSSTALRVQTSSGTSLLTVDTLTSNVTISKLTVTGTSTLNDTTVIGGGVNAFTTTLATVRTFSSTSSCNSGCYGIVSATTIDNPTNPTSATGIRVQLGAANSSFTLGAATGISIQALTKGASATITEVNGMTIAAQTVGGTSNYGLRIGAAGTNTLWLSDNTDTGNALTAAGGIVWGNSKDTNLYRSAANTLRTDDTFLAATGLQVGAASSEILRAVVDTSLARDQYKVTVGRGDATYPEGLARDQLYVFGRINSSWQMWWEDCMVARIGTAATANGAMGGFSRGGGTTAQLAVPVTAAGTSGICRLNFNTPAANSTGIWGSGFTATERSLNPVLEARVSATSNNDQRAIVGFTDLAAASSITTDTNQSANQAFFRKQAAGTNWEVVTRNGSGTETITTTALSTSANRRLRVEMDDTGAQVKFYIDGTLVATHNDASVPATATRLSFAIINNVTATTSRNLDVDYFRVWSDDPIGASNEGTAETPSEEEIAAAQNPEAYDATNLSFNFAGESVEVAENELDAVFNKLKAGEIYADTIFTDKIKANQIEGLEILVNRLGVLPVSQPTDTNDSEDTAVPQTALDLNDFKVSTATITKDLSVNGKLFANGGLIIAGPAEFKGTSIFHRLATFVDKVIFQNDVQFKGTATFNNNTAGFATIYKTQNKVEVKFDPAFTDVPVVTVTNKNGKFIPFAYKDLGKEGFTIVLEEEATEDIEFAWTAIQVTDARTVDMPLPEY